MLRNTAAVAVALCMCLGLAACGQKGALYMPDEKGPRNSNFIFGGDARKDSKAPSADAPVSSVSPASTVTSDSSNAGGSAS